MRALALFAAATLFGAPAHAGCEFVSGPCATDSRGNTYRSEQNLGGGYTNYTNARATSHTSQDISGNWRERFNDGSSRTYDYNPYETQQRDRPRW